MSTELQPSLSDLGYETLVDHELTLDHPQVVSWTNHYRKRLHSRGIFSRFSDRHGTSSTSLAKSAAANWHQFSEFMPLLLCQAAAAMPHNQLRHYIVQTAFEELGQRNVSEIHAEMFASAVKELNSPGDLRGNSRVSNLLELLAGLVRTSDRYEEVMGLLLGLEIPAQENIETLFFCMAVDDAIENKLVQSKFFQIHRQIEVEHVRLNIATFIRFVKTKEQRANFDRGFVKALDFWSDFWTLVSEASEQARGGNH